MSNDKRDSGSQQIVRLREKMNYTYTMVTTSTVILRAPVQIKVESQKLITSNMKQGLQKNVGYGSRENYHIGQGVKQT